MNQTVSIIPKEEVVDGIIALTTQANINVEITKKGLDVTRDSLNSFGKSFKQFKSHLPLVALIMNLVGYGLSLIACCLDKSSPVYFRAVSALCLVLMAIGACAIVSFSVTNPLIALSIGIAIIITNVVLKLAETGIELVKLYRYKCALKAPLDEEAKSIKLQKLNDKRELLENKLDGLLYQLNGEGGKSSVLSKVSKTQSALYSVQQKIQQTQDQQAYLTSKIIQQKKEVKSKVRGLGFCVLGSIMGVTGLFFAPAHALLGVAITIGSFCLDCLGLYRKVRAKLNGFKREKKNRQQEANTKNEQIISSISRIKAQEIKQNESYRQVMNELMALNASNASSFDDKAINKGSVKSNTKQHCHKVKFFPQSSTVLNTNTLKTSVIKGG